MISIIPELELFLLEVQHEAPVQLGGLPAVRRRYIQGSEQGLELKY